MKVLFIGGTGRLSKDVAKFSLSRGWEVYLLTRGTKEREKFVDKRYHMVYGDIRQPIECQQILKDYDFDVVIDFLSYNVEQLKQTLAIIENKYKQFIFISTATVYKKKNEDEIISENTTGIGNDNWDYAYDKYKCEKYLENYFDNKSEDYTIIRPYVTYGNTRVPYPLVPLENSKEWSLVNRIIEGKEIPIFDKDEKRTTLTHTKDFAIGVVGLFLNKKAYGEAFHITSDVNVTWGKVLLTIGDVLGKEVKIVDLSQEKIYTSLEEYKGVLIGDKGNNMIFDNSKIHDAVPEFKTNILLYEGIKDMIKFYQSNYNLQKVDYTWDGKIDYLLKKELGIKLYPNKNIKGANFIKYYIGRYSTFYCLYNMLRKLKSIIIR